ncbi:hypothetical protein BLNAU_2648 [Blattamonas nauphoetae]|uniref:Uncharacterized protein n=1 Tax=Blattamonas nauphoetae TaxID=2049346 RepID=A0ABQ9YFH4_9EUKA|nr:hypothetical protein BLNAU_2648 [Blattamonas nauphoetae]
MYDPSTTKESGPKRRSKIQWVSPTTLSTDMIQARLESQSPAISAASSASLIVTGGEDLNLKPHRDSSPTKLAHSEQFPSFSDSLLSRFESIKDKTQRQAQHIIRSQRSARQSQLTQNQVNDDTIKKRKRDEPTSSDITDSTESPKQEEKPVIQPDTAFRQLSAVLNSLYSQSQTLEGASVPLFDSSPPSSQRSKCLSTDAARNTTNINRCSTSDFIKFYPLTNTN